MLWLSQKILKFDITGADGPHLYNTCGSQLLKPPAEVFYSISKKPGWLQPGCINESTFEKILGNIGQLKPDQKIEIKVDAEADLSKF